MVLVAAFPVTFFLALLRPRRENVSWAIAATLFGVLWIGLRDGPRDLAARARHHRGRRQIVTGMGLVFDVLIATFVGDTFAYFVGRAYGRHPIAPLISPNKTLEGLVGGVVGGTLAFWCAGLYQDWLTGWRRAADRLPGGARGAGRRPVRVADQARPGGQGHRARCSARTAACSTASTRCSSRSWSGTTRRSGWGTARTAAGRRTSPAPAWPAPGRPRRRSGPRRTAPAGRPPRRPGGRSRARSA